MQAKFITDPLDLVKVLDELLDDELAALMVRVNARTLLALDTAIALVVNKRTGSAFTPRFVIEPESPEAASAGDAEPPAEVPGPEGARA